ncbi:KTSC domain-containing protein [Pedobacter montanisoli]|uniref:KTSC domain-containing protein n=1 Tax=Pedobacter montanisoli TaxID=2923277 RepID=A0ABS9ZZH1_9SPHI|nr:KTSC domain-containing protein [Pedobacter montanisoli]MCJ0743715.1 KTSC domain-containing protein [Pedobacter montanisoli]
MPSSVIAHISYQAEKEALTVVFNSGDVYLYEKVPEKIYKEFKAAVSKGKYLNRKLKKLFTGKKIAPL